MPYSYYNPNPTGKRVGDCAIRAVAKALGIDWPTAYAMVVSNGFTMGELPEDKRREVQRFVDKMERM